MGKDYARKPSATILSNSSHLSDSMPAEPLPTTKIKKKKNKKIKNKENLSLAELVVLLSKELLNKATPVDREYKCPHIT